MLVVTTGELSNPVPQFVLMKSGDGTVHDATD